MILLFNITLFVVIILAYLTVTLTDSLQIYFEETETVTLYCSKCNFSYVDVYMVKDNKRENILSCLPEQPCQSQVGTEALFNESGLYFSTVLSNLTIRRSITGVMCVFKNSNNVNDHYIYYEDVAIIAKPENISCLETQVNSSSAHISITCRAAKSYPAALCNFNVQPMVPGQVSYSFYKYTNIVDYYSSNCTWTSSLHGFQVGNYTLDVSFYPNVNETGIPENINITASIKTSILLTLPNISLSNECFNGFNITDGYIRPGSTATCICYLNNIGYPPAILKWSNSNHSDLGTAINNTATALTIDPFSNNVAYSCRALTNLANENVSIIYSARYAKGPLTCSVELSNKNQTVWNMCETTFINWTINCQVSQSDVSPGIKAIIRINSDYSNLLHSQNVTDLYQVKHEINITYSGTYSVGCEVQNIKFSDVKATCSYLQVLQVMEPPKAPPTLAIKNDSKDVLDGVQENKVYTVECRAPGGTPTVSNITVSCGNIKESTFSGNIFTSPVSFTRNMTGQSCTCLAKHTSGCYANNTSTKMPNIFYKSTVTILNVSSTIIENGTFAHLNCNAEGNPPPNIFISKGNKIIAQNLNSYTLVYNKSMSCKDAGYYICQSNNEIDLNDKDFKQITLRVRCPLQYTTDTNFMNFSLLQGNSFSYNLTMYGYPEPDTYKIVKSPLDSNDVIVIYSAMEPPYLNIELKILNLKSTDFGHYTLAIFQNGSQSLSFDFIIKQDTEEKSFFVAAIGGGVAAGCFAIILAIFSTYLYRGKSLVPEKSNIYNSCKNPTLDIGNSDIYLAKVKKQGTSKKMKEIESEKYKNYKDIVPTIISATAVPKNMYKPEVKPKIKNNNNFEYYNFVQPLVPSGHDFSDKHYTLDENVYANQGFNEK